MAGTMGMTGMGWPGRGSRIFAGRFPIYRNGGAGRVAPGVLAGAGMGDGSSPPGRGEVSPEGRNLGKFVAGGVDNGRGVGGWVGYFT